MKLLVTYMEDMQVQVMQGIMKLILPVVLLKILVFMVHVEMAMVMLQL